MAEKVQVVTGNSVEIAYVDQGYTGENAEQAAKQAGIELAVMDVLTPAVRDVQEGEPSRLQAALTSKPRVWPGVRMLPGSVQVCVVWKVCSLHPMFPPCL